MSARPSGQEIITIEAIAGQKRSRIRCRTTWIENSTSRNAATARSDQIMQAISLLAKDKPKPSDDTDIEAGMAGNICRCGTYQRIRAAIKAAAGENA